MRKALTDAAVQRLKPPSSGQTDIFDSGYPGLALRISYGGRRAWVCFTRENGKLKRVSLGLYPAVSLAEAREAWRNVRAGREPRHHNNDGPTFEEAFEEWLKRDQSDNRTSNEARRLISKDVLPVLGRRPLSDIGRADLLRVIDEVSDRAPVTARRVFGRLHRLFKWHVGRGNIAANPLADAPKPGTETKRDRVLSDAELKTVWDAANEWPFGAAIRLLILTGARRSEIGDLRRYEIDGDTIRLRGERTKNGEPHTIPLSPPARAILDTLPRIHGSDFVFTTTGDTPISGWSVAKRRLPELKEPWTIHDLRRTVATGLQKLGVTLQTIEAVLGHTSGSRSGVVRVYQRHSFDAEKRTALDAWGKHVALLVESR
jgi:integrase